MKRVIILLSVLAMTLGSMAQQNQHSNYIGLNLGGGMNTMLYPKSNGWTVGCGYLGELRYTHFFGPHFGVGAGLGYSRVNGRYNYNWDNVEAGLTHPDNGLTYDLHTVADHWMERQSVSMLTVPIEFFWRAPVNESWSFLAGLGAEVELPLKATYDAYSGKVETQGYFPATNVTYSNLPDHGFRVYDADYQGTIEDVAKCGVSIVADLGLNYALNDNYGLYFGLYCGYGLTNLRTANSNDPLIAISASDASQLDYKGVWASEEISDAHLFYFGAKVGVNLGWECEKHESKGNGGNAELTSYDNNNANGQNAGGNAGPANQNAQAANQDNGAANQSTMEEDKAAEARCDARRMNDPELKAAMANIDADIEAAEQMADEAGNNEAVSMIADAKAKVVDAKVAYGKGKYCRAYDLMTAAYGDLAGSYSSDAKVFSESSKLPEADKAAHDAELYANAARKDGLDCAAAATRNAKLNAEIARDAERMAKGRAAAIMDPSFADALAQEALAMATDAKCQPAVTSAKDASGKAYRGDFGGSYAASANSFAMSAKAFADNSEATDEAKEAVEEAQSFAKEAADAARMGDVEGSYRAARRAQEAAERARGRESVKPDNTNRQDLQNNDNTSRQPVLNPETAPIDRESLEKYLAQISGTVVFDFRRTEPKFDSKTDLAIRALCRAMKADSNVKILITGHTDCIGSKEKNMTLGRHRAEALKALMVNLGAPAQCISTASKGESEPVVDNETEEHRQQNRRAVITLR